MGAKLADMAVKEVLSALKVLASDVPLHCQAWPGSRAFEALISDYFARSDDDSGDSENLIVTTMVFPLVSAHLNYSQAF